ncbi:MAG: peroxiredoxin-like family protein [Jatrophihabitantaceae bacterium]
MPDLKSQLDGITRAIPEQIGARIAAGVAELATSGVAPGLPVGSAAPAFSLPDAYGATVALDDLLTSGPAVITFYRGDWCPYCNLQLRALQESLSQIQDAGASLVAISAQAPDHGSELISKHELKFPVLSDLDQSVSEAYKVRFDLSGELEDLQVNVFQNDPAAQNADGRRSLSVASTFIVDADRVVRFSSVEADWRIRVEPADIVAALVSL